MVKKKIDKISIWKLHCYTCDKQVEALVATTKRLLVSVELKCGHKGSMAQRLLGDVDTTHK